MTARSNPSPLFDRTHFAISKTLRACKIWQAADAVSLLHLDYYYALSGHSCTYSLHVHNSNLTHFYIQHTARFRVHWVKQVHLICLFVPWGNIINFQK